MPAEPTSRLARLRCRACGAERSVPTPGDEAGAQFCEECFGPLDLGVDVDQLRAAPPARPDDGAAIPESGGATAPGRSGLWRYQPLLAVDGSPVEAMLAPGATPLVRAERLGDALGLERLWLKDETANPTGSFKDRLVATALARGLAAGDRVVACASTGNLARAALWAADRLGLDHVVLVPADLDDTSPADPALAGAIRVRGGYDGINRLSVELADEHPEWAWLNIGLRPWYLEGAAALAFEIAEQLDWTLPRHVVAPIASGASLLRMHRAFGELVAAGWVSEVPESPVAVSPAQPAGCAPVAAAFAAGTDDVRPVRPDTRAHSLAMGDPPDGYDLLAAIRASGGVAESVAEDRIDRGVQLLAEAQGIAAEPAGGVAVEALRQMVAAGVVRSDERVVLCVTGGAPRSAPANLGGRAARPPATIDPVVEALAGVLPEHLRDS